jgi:hypothetical protein
MSQGIHISNAPAALELTIFGLEIRPPVHQARGAMSLGNWFPCGWASCAARCVTDHTDRVNMQDTVAGCTLVAAPVRGPR